MYIKALEIDHFKSFANDMTIPFLQGFTTVSGPNGSGKSNIIDSVLFALGFSGSRTLRAEKLSDYISLHNSKRNDAYVKVTFGLEGKDGEEISVARRLKKGSQGYNSVYYLNDKTCTLSEIHMELEKYNITPNSYNVVMQNDVMSITNCNNNDRRKIIEEIAGTAEFDRQIEKAENELQVVESRVESTNILLEELTKTIERLSEEREVALKYEGLKNEKTALESQVTAVKYFDIMKSTERVHESILEFGKRKKEKEFTLKNLEDNLVKIKEKFEEIQKKVKENGEAEQIEVIRNIEELKGKIERKKNAIDQADVTIHNNEKRVIFGLQNGIEAANDKINKANENIVNLQKEIEGLNFSLKAENDELQRILSEVAGLSQTADALVAERASLQKELENLRVSELNLEKDILPLENSLQQNQKTIEFAKKSIEDLTNFKATFKDEKDKLDLQVEELEKELKDYRTVQENSIIDLENIKNAINDKARDIQLTTRKQAMLEGQRAASETLSDRANDTILKANIDGVHSSLMNLGSVDDEYATALEVAMGARMRNIVVDDADVAKICIEMLKTNRAGTTTFIPLDKIKPAPRSLNLPKDKGVIDFAINLIDFDDEYIDAFYLALGDTLIVEDYEVAKKLIGKYRTVTLSGELFDKSGAITGGDRRKVGGMKFASSSENELNKCIEHLAVLQKEWNDLNDKREAIETRQARIRQDYSNAQTTCSSAKIELKNLIRQSEEADGKIEKFKQDIATAEPEIVSATKKLDAMEIQRVELNDKMLVLQDKIAEINAKMSEGELKKLKEKTDEVEQRIKTIESKIQFKNNEIVQQNQQIEFQNTVIHDNEERIVHTKAENVELEKDKVKFAEEMKVHEAELKEKEIVREQLGEKLKQFQEERDVVQKEMLESEKAKDVLVNDLARIGEQIESFRARRRELEPQLEQITNELKEAGVEVKNLVAPSMSTEEITSKIQRLQKRMSDLEPVNMNAIKSYDEQMNRKNELDEKIAVLTKERAEIEQRMTGYGEAKKDAFTTTYNAINNNFKSVFEQLADGEGTLILENEENPFAGGMTMRVKPRGKDNRKLIQLSGGEKALTALALVFAIQRYLPAPFYAFDEVDSSLDGINVEKLATMIKEQSKNTQFIVVSHRKPMIESANRTIGVTQKEKGITKVTGISRD